MKNFILLTTPRSGSTWLGTYIDSHPQAVMYGELFLRHAVPEKYKELRANDPEKFFAFPSSTIRPWKTWQYLDHVFTRAPDMASGFKLMAWPFLTHPEVISYLNKNDIHIITLHRDLSERVLSYAVANHRNNFHNLSQDTDKKEKIILDMRKVKKLAYKQKKLTQLMNVLQKTISSPCLSLDYAQLQNAPESTLNNVFDFLGVSPHTATSPLHKSTPVPYKDILTNYDEITAFLKNL